MNIHGIASASLAATMMVAGCTADHASMSFGSSNFANGKVTATTAMTTVHVKHAPDAVISANGDLRIGDTDVAVSPAQQALLRDYHRNALAVREHGIATGKAGAAVAVQAIGSVAKGLASGNTDNIDKEVDAKAARVEQEAQKICLDLVGVKAAQDALAAQLPAFKPYAGVVDADAVDECDKQVQR